MTTNEPSTEEIVRNFRGAHIFGITQALENRIADRLEAQEREIFTLDSLIDAVRDENACLNLQSIELTDRAEQKDCEIERLNGLVYALSPSEIPCCKCGGECIEFSIPSDLWNYVMRPDGRETDEEYICLNCWSDAVRSKFSDLNIRAEQAEKERDAAKADMKLIVDAVRETHCDETCCFACKYDCDTSINDSGEFNNECPGFDRDDCFEWRGLPQDGEE